MKVKLMAAIVAALFATGLYAADSSTTTTETHKHHKHHSKKSEKSADTTETAAPAPADNSSSPAQ